MVKKKLKKNWQMGFFGFFAFFAIPGLLRGEIVWASWLLWMVWFVYFIPIEVEK